MRFDTAIQRLRAGKPHTISLDRYDRHLSIRRHLLNRNIIHDVELCDLRYKRIDIIKGPTDETIAAMLARNNLSLTGWTLGDKYNTEDQRRYNNPAIYFSILDAFRQNENLFSNMYEFCEMVRSKIEDIDRRTVKIHALSLIEDHRGLIEEEDNSIRLMMWQEALELSKPLAEIEQVQYAEITKKSYGSPDLFVPRARIYLNGEYPHAHSWEIHPENGGFTVHEFRNSVKDGHQGSGVSFHGDERSVDCFFQKWELPLGWGATYGYNVSNYERWIKILESENA